MMNDTLYEALPYAYIGAGLLNGVLLDSELKYLPAILLISAGLLVMTWRIRARTPKAKAHSTTQARTRSGYPRSR
jgi:hypothetical protein